MSVQCSALHGVNPNFKKKSFIYLKTCNFTKKEPHGSYFPMTFEKIFQNTVLYQNTGKGTERTEVFDFRSENFRKVHPKETVMKSFFS